jgi:S-adenosylmethionine-diacylglycerol 3-amino-3-carboxypropyl transferase
MGSIAKTPKNVAVRDAVHRHDHLTKQGILERAFSFAFRGLVYAQIWEDPDVDMEALQIQPDSHVVTIASGGCNVLSYLTANPRAITAVDLNPAHIALNNLKQQAAQHLPDYASFHRFFAQADRPENIEAYKKYIRPNLDEKSRRYWESRDMLGRRRISGFKSGFYKKGLLGGLIGFVHVMAKAYGIDPKEILEAKTIEEQREIFQAKFAPFFEKKFLRWLVDQPAALFGFGIPPAQYDLLKADDQQGITGALKVRLEKLACDFELKDNYFAWQAFGRGYGEGPSAPLPPYLKAENYESVVERANRVEIRHQNFAEYLESMPAQSLDRYVLLDAQDWMTDEQLTRLWTGITRTARPGARVLYRTAAAPDVVKGHIPDELMNQWESEPQAKLDDWTRRDRSAVYGGTHVWMLKPHA